MNLTPREKDKLLVAMAAVVARRRLERGVKLNHPEAIALISAPLVEGAREGRGVAGLMGDGPGGCGPSSRSRLMSASTPMPSASAWKLVMMRWRRTEDATRCTSSQDT